MNFTLVERGWDRVIDDAVHAKRNGARLYIVCPFIKKEAANRFLRNGDFSRIQVITRFDLNGFRGGVCDTSALRYLMNSGAQIRGVRNLHAKVYVIGKRVIVTSANLTDQALTRNHEFGFWSDDPTVLASCQSYFDGLWVRAGKDLDEAKIDKWDERIRAAMARAAGAPAPERLEDEGMDLGFPADATVTPSTTNSAEQCFVKFFGRASERSPLSVSVLDEVNSSASHWALSYPTTKPPRNVKNGALMFIARMVKPNDISIYGRGIATAYRPGLDDATPGDILAREWKERWSRYIRVSQTEFINGTLGDGISLGELMHELGPMSFARSKARSLSGERNISLRMVYAKQAQVELTPEAAGWLNDRLNRTFERMGRITAEALDDLIHPAPMTRRSR